MENDITIKTFIRFLKENGVYAAYVKNFRAQANKRMIWCNTTYNSKFYGPIDNGIKDFCNKIVEKKFLVSFSFEWSGTEQRHSFWNEISNKWISTIKQY